MANLYVMEFDNNKLQCSGISGFPEIIFLSESEAVDGVTGAYIANLYTMESGNEKITVLLFLWVSRE